jgi:2-methylfumaryl-CoA hydratase
MSAVKTNPGNFFEDFKLGQEIRHAVPRTLVKGDQALYMALYGNRFACSSSAEFAKRIGYPDWPLDDLLVFHIVFGKTVPDISLNAVANLGYADGRFAQPVYPGDTLSAVSKVIGLKENSDGKTGVVYVRSTGFNQKDEMVLDYARWVMVRKRDAGSKAPDAVVPDLPKAVDAGRLACLAIEPAQYDCRLAGSPHLWDDYEAGERIDHVDGITVEESEHMLATKLYQNTAKVHFNLHAEKAGRFGKRIVYGGHVISLARSLSFNGLANAFKVAAINGGRHIAPIFAGDTVYAWTKVAEKMELPGRKDVGALRLVTIAAKDRPCADFPHKTAEGFDPAVVLEFDYTVLMPRRA